MSHRTAPLRVRIHIQSSLSSSSQTKAGIHLSSLTGWVFSSHIVSILSLRAERRGPSSCQPFNNDTMWSVGGVATAHAQGAEFGGNAKSINQQYHFTAYLSWGIMMCLTCILLPRHKAGCIAFWDSINWLQCKKKRLCMQAQACRPSIVESKQTASPFLVQTVLPLISSKT